jgi:hypothetical protein
MYDEATRGDGIRRQKDGQGPYRLCLPGFVSEEVVGLGDAIERGTSTAGVRPCGGCGRRATALNRWIAFSGQYPR